MLFEEFNLIESLAYMLPLLHYLILATPGILDWLPSTQSVKGSRVFVKQILKHIGSNHQAVSDFPEILEKMSAFAATIRPPSLSSEEETIPRKRRKKETEERRKGGEETEQEEKDERKLSVKKPINLNAIQLLLKSWIGKKFSFKHSWTLNAPSPIKFEDHPSLESATSIIDGLGAELQCQPEAHSSWQTYFASLRKHLDAILRSLNQ